MNYSHEFTTFVQTHPPEKQGDGFHASGSPRIHHGLSNPTLRQFVKDWAREHPALAYGDWLATMSGLYEGESIDERMLAGFMLGQYDRFRTQLPLATLDAWIGQLEGWREIDTTCQSNFTAKEVLASWDQWQPFLVDLANRNTTQHRRASLVLLVKPVRDSGDERLMATALANVERLQQETDKLITKAISWVLREAIKRHLAMVSAYVLANKDALPAIAVREFYKKLQTGIK